MSQQERGSSSSQSKDKAFNYEETVRNLNTFYRQVKRQILKYQSPTTGLFPCDLSKENPTEAHVRDSVYCAAAAWALAQAYKRIDDDKGRTHELAQSAVKCMRGVLACWLRQADRVEKFKHNQNPKNALHSKFHLVTGDPVAKDEDYEHLQIDCVALYLLFLVQMIQSGLQIIFTTDEVNFIQNLVFYMERAYRTPDFGMWERGSKYNNGSSELHASSIGMSKAALEAVNGSNLYGLKGAHWSSVFIDIDAHYRNRSTIDNLLPRESASKNTDASLLPTISWPAFAIHEDNLINRTTSKIIRKLAGRYGFKRFLRDGYKTAVEDGNKRFYRPAEIKLFDAIECEWPIFFAYMVIDSIYRGDQKKVNYWQEKLDPLLKRSNDGPIMPKYYYVPAENVEAERARPGSQIRVPSTEGENDNLFLWGQAVYIISQLLRSGLVAVWELDPLRRHQPASRRHKVASRYSMFQSSPTDLVIQVVLIAESVRLQQMLATYGITTQTPHQVEPVQIWPPSELVKAYERLGVNEKLGLSGRPARPIGGLGTAKMYRACGHTFICYPLLFERSDFYLSQDLEFTLEDVKTDLQFLGKYWKLAGRPTFCMIIREDNLRGKNARCIFDLLSQFKRGECDGLKIRLGRLQEFVSSACIEHLDFLSDHTGRHHDIVFNTFVEKDQGRQFRSLTDIPKAVDQSTRPSTLPAWVDYQTLQSKPNDELLEMYHHTQNVYCKAQVLQTFLTREGLYSKVDGRTVEERLEDLVQHAGSNQIWAVVRFASSLLGKVVDSLAPSITAILVRGKQVTIGVFGHDEEVIDKPLAPRDIKNILYSRCFSHDVVQAVLQQELIINIGKFLSTNPAMFAGILKIRIGWIVQAMQLELNYMEKKELYLSNMSPSAVKKLLKRTLTINPCGHDDCRSVFWNRQLDGALNRVPRDFYDRVWEILDRTPAGLKVAGYHLPQQPTLSDMTQYELNFSLLVEQMLVKIVDPAYRQMMVETFMVVASILERNKEVSFQKPVDMDKLVHEAFDLFQRERSETEEMEKSDDMNAFYSTAPNIRGGTTTYIAKAVVNLLLDGEITGLDDARCVVS